MLHTKSGARVEILLNASCRMDYDGNIVGVVGVGQDITDLKRAEKEVKHIAQDLARLIDTANAPIFGIDQKGKVNEWNAKVAQITGFSREEVMGRHLVSTFISSEFQYAVSPLSASFA
jgi:PAS domain-containing protein